MSAPGQDDWESHWTEYAETVSRNPAQIMRHALISRCLRKLCAAEQPIRLLDVGSGQGDLLAKLQHEFPQAELAGVELSRRGVEISQRKVPRARFWIADLFQPSEELASLRGWATHAVCSEVLEHVDAPERFLSAMSAYLAPGARVVVTVPGGPMSAFDRYIGHRRHFDRAAVARVLRDGGFEVERVLRSGFPFFNLYRCLVILRGDRLAQDVQSKNQGASARVAEMTMTAFRQLFRFNLTNSALGWQMVAVARKPSSA